MIPAMKLPSKRAVAQAKREVKEEIRIAEEQKRARSRKLLDGLPSEHPDHVCGLMCDGQDGASSYCARLRFKLFGAR